MVLRVLQQQQHMILLSGQLVVTVANHGFTTSDKIRIEDNSLTFTCTKDGNHENKTYPRSTDPFSGRWLRPTAVTTNTLLLTLVLLLLLINMFTHL